MRKHEKNHEKQTSTAKKKEGKWKINVTNENHICTKIVLRRKNRGEKPQESPESAGSLGELERPG